MVANSVFTGAGALAALRNLSDVNKQLAQTQSRVGSGLRVASAIDNTSSFAIAQGIRGELKQVDSIGQGLATLKAIGDVGLAGAKAISDLLPEISAKLTELVNTNLTTAQRTLIRSEFVRLASQANDIVATSVFRGIRLLTGTASATALATIDNNALTGGGTPGTTPGGALRVTAVKLVGTQITSLAAAITGTATNAQSVILAQYAGLESVVNTALSSLGAEVRAITLHQSLLENLRSSVDASLSSYVDADLARESARLTSLQVQQQLAVQGVGIANQRPQSLLGLFR